MRSVVSASSRSTSRSTCVPLRDERAGRPEAQRAVGEIHLDDRRREERIAEDAVDLQAAAEVVRDVERRHDDVVHGRAVDLQPRQRRDGEAAAARRAAHFQRAAAVDARGFEHRAVDQDRLRAGVEDEEPVLVRDAHGDADVAAALDERHGVHAVGREQPRHERRERRRIDRLVEPHRRRLLHGVEAVVAVGERVAKRDLAAL